MHEALHVFPVSMWLFSGSQVLWFSSTVHEYADKQLGYAKLQLDRNVCVHNALPLTVVPSRVNSSAHCCWDWLHCSTAY